jgi:hypothetical protein
MGQAVRESRSFSSFLGVHWMTPVDDGMTVIRYPWMMDEP